MTDSIELQNLKKEVRTRCMKNRRDWSDNVTTETCLDIAKNFLENYDVKGKVVSGFLPIGSEIDVRPLLQMCLDAGAQICLPCVVENNAPLVFRTWHEGDDLVKESFGTRAPHPDKQELIPDVIITPMLAFDNKGYRLGYGGGFYDRTFAKLRALKDIVGIGVALDIQHIDTVPIGEYDMPQDMVITENKRFLYKRDEK